MSDDVANMAWVPALQRDLSRTVESLHARYRAYVLSSLRLLGIPSVDLDDALQDVFIVVFQRLPEYADRGRTRSWLYAICIRVAGARRRRGARHPVARVDEIELPVPAAQLELVLQDETVALGKRLLQRLKPEERDVFWLYEVEDRSMPEIARALRCPVQTAYSRLYRARERIAQEVHSAAVGQAC